MTEYSTTETEMDFGNDVEELLMKVEKLNGANEFLSKQLREKEHVLTQRVAEFQMENEKLKQSNENLEELLKSYKTTEANTKPENSEEEDISEKVGELENKLFLAEQGEQNLKRQNQNLNMEISNLKLEIDKLNLNSKSAETSSILKGTNANADFDVFDEETKNLLNELMNEIEELKKEKNEVSEKALNLLTEKELEIMEIREEMEQLKKTNSQEINKLMEQVGNLKSDLDDKDFRRDENDDDRQSFNSEEARVLLEKYKELQDEFDDYKREVYENEKVLLYENDRLKREQEMTEETYKSTIQDLEIEISKLKAEENENSNIDRFGNQEDDKNMFLNEIENFQAQIRHLEEAKEKSEFRFKDQIQQLNADIKELDSVNSQLKQQKGEAEKELSSLKANFNKSIKEKEEKQKIELGIKEKEVLQMKDRIEMLSKDSENLRKDYEIAKKNSEKTKIEYRELNENLKKLKENNLNELKKWEERYFVLEKKLENEKHSLNEQNKDLLQKLNTANAFIKQLSERENQTDLVNPQVEGEETKNSLSNMLDNNDEVNNKVLLLNEEITLLNNQIIEQNAKLKFLEKNKKEIDIFSKENVKLKSDFKEMKEMYEKQIKDLQSKAMQMASELKSSSRKTSVKTSVKGDMSLNPKQMQVLVELESNMSKLTAENKYLAGKIEILHKEIDNLRLLRDNDVKFLKEEVRVAEDQAINAKVALATFAFERDTELIKYRNMIKKLRMQVSGGVLTGNAGISKQQTPTKNKK